MDVDLGAQGSAPPPVKAPKQPETQAPLYLPQLDGVRGIACLMVLIAHLQAVRGLDWLMARLQAMRGLHWLPDQMATAGVALFFVLSGFLITRILIADKEQRRGLNTFYNRRFARIFPIYFLLLAALAVLWPGKEIGWAATFTFNLRYVTDIREYFHIDAGSSPIPPIAHLWSLCVEEHFYWIWPALIWLLPARFYRWLPLLCIGLTPAITQVIVSELRGHGFQAAAIEGLVSRLTVTQWVALSLGALAAIYERHLWRTVRFLRAELRLLPILGALLLLIGCAGLKYIGAPGMERIRTVWQPTLLHLACGGLFALGLACRSLGRIGWLNRVGRISYGLYLYHLPIYAAFGLARTGVVISPWRGGAALLVTFVVAVISYRFIEAPILAWMRQGRRLTVARGRFAISLGTAVTAVLGLAVVGQTVLFFHVHPLIPRKWQYAKLRPEEYPQSVGANCAYRWMGVVHAIDGDGFRRTTPIPAKTPGVPRVAIVGDSYVWGACVPAHQVLAAVTETLLRYQGVRMEVLNLGKPSGQIEQTLKIVRENALPLEPDVVVYASSLGRIRFGRPVKEVYTDPAFTNRYRSSIRAMHEECRTRGVILQVIPFTQSPDDAGTVDAVHFLQELCETEGVPVIPVEEYLRNNRHCNFRFSRWDTHPNAQCHRLYAGMVAAKLLQLWKHGDLDRGSIPGDCQPVGNRPIGQ